MTAWPDWMTPEDRAEAAMAESVIATTLAEFGDQVLTPELSSKIRDRLMGLTS